MSKLNGVLGGYKFPMTTIEVPELGNNVTLRQLSSADVKSYRKRLVTETTVPDGKGGVRVDLALVRDIDAQALLIAMSVCNDDGERCYTDEDAQAIAEALPQSAINCIFEAAQELSGLKPKAVEDAEKNSEGAPSASPSSTLRTLSDPPSPN